MATPIFIKRMVATLVDKRNMSVDKAFAISVSYYQKEGAIEKGSTKLTGYGKRLVKKHEGKERSNPLLPVYDSIMSNSSKNESFGDPLRSAKWRKFLSFSNISAPEETISQIPLYERMVLFVASQQ